LVTEQQGSEVAEPLFVTKKAHHLHSMAFYRQPTYNQAQPHFNRPVSVAPQLPPGWEQCVDAQGRVFYKDHINKKTSWNPPPAVPQLPPGWEMRTTADGKAFYVDHNTQTTHWQPPAAPVPGLQHQPSNNNLMPVVQQPMQGVARVPSFNPQAVVPAQPEEGLPLGWESKKTPQGRVYYVNHESKTTQWERPQMPVARAPDPHAAPEGEGFGAAVQPAFSPLVVGDLGEGEAIEPETKEPHEQRRRQTATALANSVANDSDSVTKKDMYVAVLKAVMVDGKLDAGEEALLIQIRQQHGISIEQHEAYLKELGVSENDYHKAQEAGADDPEKRECIFCLDAVPDHVCLDCMHMCLCGDCAQTILNSSEAMRKCPVCRADVRDIKKVFWYV